MSYYHTGQHNIVLLIYGRLGHMSSNVVKFHCIVVFLLEGSMHFSGSLR